MKDYLDITLFDSVQERYQSVDWAGLTDAEREFVGVDLCVGQVAQNSMHGFLANCAPHFQRAAIAGLRRIGATATADVVARAVALFPGGEPPESADDRWAALRADLDAEPSATAALTAAFEAAADREDPNGSFERYAAAHPSEFLGPRNLVDLWRSRQARGVAVPPERLAKLERDAASDAASTDDRCPACGQPMPGYRKSCKRCGRARG